MKCYDKNQKTKMGEVKGDLRDEKKFGKKAQVAKKQVRITHPLYVYIKKQMGKEKKNKRRGQKSTIC